MLVVFSNALNGCSGWGVGEILLYADSTLVDVWPWSISTPGCRVEADRIGRAVGSTHHALPRPICPPHSRAHIRPVTLYRRGPTEQRCCETGQTTDDDDAAPRRTVASLSRTQHACHSGVRCCARHHVPVSRCELTPKAVAAGRQLHRALQLLSSILEYHTSDTSTSHHTVDTSSHSNSHLAIPFPPYRLPAPLSVVMR